MATAARLCVQCRRLFPVTEGEGYRGAADLPRTCGACGGSSLVDPADPETALALHQLDDEERLARTSQARRVSLRIASALGLATAILVVFQLLMALFYGWGKGEQVFWLLALAIGGLIAIPMALAGGRAVSGLWRRTEALPEPARWALALPAPGRTPLHDGILQCERPIFSPLSGRACAAYEIGIRRDRDGHAPRGTWLLLEQGAADFRVGDRDCAGAKVYVEATRREVEVDGDQLRAFLRSRGIADEGGLVAFETLVQPDTRAAITTAGNDVILLLPFDRQVR